MSTDATSQLLLLTTNTETTPSLPPSLPPSLLTIRPNALHVPCVDLSASGAYVVGLPGGEGGREGGGEQQVRNW